MTICLSYPQNVVTYLYFSRTMYESKPKSKFYSVKTKQPKTLILPAENQTCFQKDMYMLRKGAGRMHPQLVTVDMWGQGESEGGLSWITLYTAWHGILFDFLSLRIYSERDKLGDWDWHIHTTYIEQITNKRPTIKNQELYSMLCNGL